MSRRACGGARATATAGLCTATAGLCTATAGAGAGISRTCPAHELQGNQRQDGQHAPNKGAKFPTMFNSVSFHPCRVTFVGLQIIRFLKNLPVYFDLSIRSFYMTGLFKCSYVIHSIFNADFKGIPSHLEVDMV